MRSRAELAARFVDAANALGARREREDVFSQVHQAYTHADRHYHGIEHIVDCLALLDELRGHLASPAHVEMALWFHDVIYDTSPMSESEERSASMAVQSCLRMGIAEDVAQRIAQLVRATKRHRIPEEVRGDDVDFRAFLDIDLAVLGRDPYAYALFEKQIRAEYSWVPAIAYRLGRAKVLTTFLERESIYLHAPLRDRFEAPARKNLARASLELGSGADACFAHATDDRVFTTREGALDREYAWSDLLLVTVGPKVLVPRPHVHLAFRGAAEDVWGDLAEPSAFEVLGRLRAIPGYRHDLEAKAVSEGTTNHVLSVPENERLWGPVSLPTAGGDSPYRD
jgi:predicted metal-dependent HD superfamily phosphohydrolase